MGLLNWLRKSLNAVAFSFASSRLGPTCARRRPASAEQDRPEDLHASGSQQRPQAGSGTGQPCAQGKNHQRCRHHRLDELGGVERLLAGVKHPEKKPEGQEVIVLR